MQLRSALARNHERAHLFGRHDRLVIDGQSFRVERKVEDSHVLQPVTGDLIAEDFFVVKTDAEINGLMRSKRMRIDEGYYSKALGILRVRFDNSNLSDLSEADLRTIAWKKEWCVRFLDAAANVEGRWRPHRTLDDVERFVVENRDRLDRWYLDTFGERRRPGRRLAGEVRKAFDYPSPSTLKKWLAKFISGNCRMDSFRPRYSNCGNRNQLDPRAAAVIAVKAQEFASILRPAMADICEDVELAFYDINKNLPEDQHVYASHNAIRRRIHALDPFMVDAGRHDDDYALRKYTPVGKGLAITKALGRVEMDDWEFDLHTLIERSSIWRKLGPEQKKLVPRVRTTFTAAIDCASRCIVGFNLSVANPSAATAKPALRSVMVDKTELAAAMGARVSWHMYGKPTYVVTDGGPAFKGEFDDAAMRVGVGRVIPDQDPRMRGTIEAFFRFMKRLCRYFAGRAFANVVERGGYQAEQMAALTVEELYRTLIIFIADSYHMRPHRGLEGRTPYGKWMELEKAGLPPAPSDEQLALAFGLRLTPRTISKHGIDVLGSSYNSLRLGQLHGILGKKPAEAVVDPEDLGYVFVGIPPKARGRLDGIPENQHFLRVDCVDGVLSGRTLASVLLAKQAVREFVKAEQEAGRPIRIEAHRYITDLAENVRKSAGIATHLVNEKTLALMEARMARSGRAGLGAVDYGVQESEDGSFGRLVARSTRRRTDPDPNPSALPRSLEEQPVVKPKPFGGSLNLYESDDE